MRRSILRLAEYSRSMKSTQSATLTPSTMSSSALPSAGSPSQRRASESREREGNERTCRKLGAPDLARHVAPEPSSVAERRQSADVGEPRVELARARADRDDLGLARRCRCRSCRRRRRREAEAGSGGECGCLLVERLAELGHHLAVPDGGAGLQSGKVDVSPRSENGCREEECERDAPCRR